MKDIAKHIFLGLFLAASTSVFAAHSGITVSLNMDETNYVAGERVRCVVDIKNMLAETIHVSHTNMTDRLLLEVFLAEDGFQLERTKMRPFVAPFYLKSNQGQKFEAYLADHYDLSREVRYLVRPVLIHAGVRYEGLYRSFDIVAGMEVASASQMFTGSPGQTRVFRLLRWPRKGGEHLFLSAIDEGSKEKKWPTLDIGSMIKARKPTISILQGGEVVVLHMNGPETFARTEFWSMPDNFVFRPPQVLVHDPDTAGQHNVQEMYRKSGGVAPKSRSWWKFWD